MYNDEHENDECVTLSFYYKRMKKMKLKFHRPKRTCVVYVRRIDKVPSTDRKKKGSKKNTVNTLQKKIRLER